MSQTLYALVGVTFTAIVAYLLIFWTKGKKPRNSVMNDRKPTGDDTH